MYSSKYTWLVKEGMIISYLYVELRKSAIIKRLIEYYLICIKFEFILITETKKEDDSYSQSKNKLRYPNEKKSILLHINPKILNYKCSTSFW